MLAVLIASRGPFGPMPSSCGSLVLLLIGPFVLLALELISFVRADPISWRYGSLLVAGVAGVGTLLLRMGLPGDSAFFQAWWLVAILSMIAAPAVGVHELARRGLLRMPRWKKRSRKRRDL